MYRQEAFLGGLQHREVNKEIQLKICVPSKDLADNSRKIQPVLQGRLVM